MPQLAPGEKPKAEDIPGLMSLLSQKTLASGGAVDPLVRAGPIAVPALRKALKDPDHDFRSKSIFVLGKMGPVGKEAVPDLIAVLKDDKDWRVRSSAISTLGKMGEEAEAAVPMIIKSLTDKDVSARLNAATALGQIGPAARLAVPDLAKALEDSNFGVRKGAATSLGQLGFRAKSAIPALTKSLEDEASTVRLAAAEALLHIDPEKQTETAVQTFVKALESSTDFFIRRDAAQALGEIGPAAKVAVPALQAATQDKELLVRDVAAAALRKVDR
jgi:HEAT repeat protein